MSSPPQGAPKNASVAKGRGIRTRMIVWFSVLFLVAIISIELVSILGLPFSGYEGREAQIETSAFREINFIADLKKEALQERVREVLADVHVMATDDLFAERLKRLRPEALAALSKAGDRRAALLIARKDREYVAVEKIFARFSRPTKLSSPSTLRTPKQEECFSAPARILEPMLAGIHSSKSLSFPGPPRDCRREGKVQIQRLPSSLRTPSRMQAARPSEF